MSQDDIRVLHCNENWFDALTYFWVVILPQLILIGTSDIGCMRGEPSEDIGLYALRLVPIAYIIVCISPSKYLWKRITSGIIWLVCLVVIALELSLWFYAIYLCVPVIWFIKHKREKKNDHR